MGRKGMEEGARERTRPWESRPERLGKRKGGFGMGGGVWVQEGGQRTRGVP